jgi:hypothetical protein
MTTMSFNDAASYTWFVAPRSPKLSFAARLAALQAKREQAPHLSDAVRFAASFALALVPFTVLAWVFVTL